MKICIYTNSNADTVPGYYMNGALLSLGKKRSLYDDRTVRAEDLAGTTKRGEIFPTEE